MPFYIQHVFSYIEENRLEYQTDSSNSDTRYLRNRIRHDVLPALRDEHNPNLPRYDYDPEVAKKMLNDAGYVDKDADGIRNDPQTGQNIVLEFLVPSAWPDEVKTAKLIKEQIKDISWWTICK